MDRNVGLKTGDFGQERKIPHDPKPIKPQPLPDQLPFMGVVILKVKASICSAQLLIQSLALVDSPLIKGDYDLAYYRGILDQCGPILNSLCDQMEAAQGILRAEAERRCRNRL